MNMARDILAPNAGPLCLVAVGDASTIGATSTIGGTLDREERGGIAARSQADRAWQKRMKPPNSVSVTAPGTVCM